MGADPPPGAPGLRHRLRLPRPLRVRGAGPDGPSRVVRPRRAPPRPPRGLGCRAHDDARLLPLRLHARAGGARRAGTRVSGDRARPGPIPDGDPVWRDPATGAPRARRGHRAGVHGGPRRLRHGRDLQLPDADGGGLPRVARDVRPRGGDPARVDPPPPGRRTPGSGAPVARAGAVHPRPPPGAPARAASPGPGTGARGHPLVRGYARSRLWPPRRPARPLGRRGRQAGQRARGVPAHLDPEPRPRRRSGGRGRGGGRSSRVRAPAPSDAARGRGHPRGRTRIRSAGSRHRGGCPAPSVVARPDAGGGVRAF